MKILVLLLLLTSCSGSNEFGECIGLGEEGEKTLTYKVSVRNAFWSVIGLETIIAPILWATDYARCPVAIKEKK